jgi:hypothetical protein
MSFNREYLESFEGRKTQYWNRFAKNTIIISYNVEKYQTKRSKSVNENLRFQKYLLTELKKIKRICFRKAVAVEFYFDINQKNPPAIQSLLKHYIDLIQKPQKELKSKRKYLLLKDDSQIKALCAHYWNTEKSKNQELTIVIKPFRDFIFNLEFARDLQFESFPDRKLSSFFQEDAFYENESRLDRLIDDRNNSLQNFNGIKITINNKEIDFNEYRNQVYEEGIKQELLKVHSNLTVSSVLALITEPESSETKTPFLNFSLNKLGRSTVLNGWYNINLGSVPVNDGESILFKDRINTELKNWKNNYGKHLPNHPAIALKFFYEKPNNVTHDLDNLLKYVLPHFDMVINKDRNFKNLNSIEIYQIQTISKNKDSGNLYLRIEDLDNNNLFHIADRLLEKYEKTG